MPTNHGHPMGDLLAKQQAARNLRHVFNHSPDDHEEEEGENDVPVEQHHEETSEPNNQNTSPIRRFHRQQLFEQDNEIENSDIDAIRLAEVLESNDPSTPQAFIDLFTSPTTPTTIGRTLTVLPTTPSIPVSTNKKPTTSTEKARVFVGTWNMAAVDPFATEKGEYVGDEMAQEKLKEFFPLEYDVYVLGTQEKMSKYLHQAVLARLNMSQQRQYVRMEVSDREKSNTKATSSEDQEDTQAHEDNGQQEQQGSVPRVVQVRTLRRTNSFGIFGPRKNGLASSDRYNRPCTSRKTSTSRTYKLNDEVKGRGDGAFLHQKATSLSIYFAQDFTSQIELLYTGAYKFHFASGSKGGVALMVRLLNQTITFANCHLEANKPTIRRKQLELLTTKLTKSMGFPDVSLTNCSDHVVWMGDFNYRIQNQQSQQVLDKIAQGKHLEIHDEFDGLKQDMANGMLSQFKEPQKWPTFYPTYKKIPMRPKEYDLNNPQWPYQIYRILYKEPLYKGGKIKQRIPGWCDRILYTSSPGLKLFFDVEKVNNDTNPTTTGNTGNLQPNYKSVNDTLRESDHSPVYCTFVLTSC